jgi:hypothetical protein
MTITVGPLVWMLITASSGYYNQGNAATLGYFWEQDQCEKVRIAVKKLNSNVEATCIDVRVVLK